MGTMKGRFVPRNPQKYLGNAANICFRSSWENKCFHFLDSSSAVKHWGSEEFSLPYISPVDGKIHKYFPDLFVIYEDNKGIMHKEIIEIKPMSQTVLTDKSSPYDKLQWAINQAKWAAARAFAASKGATFRVMTEVELFGGKQPTKKRKTGPRKVKK